MRRRLAGSGAVLVAGLGVVLCALLDAQVPDAHREALDLTAGLSDALTALALSVAGATVLARSRHPLGWLMAGFGTWCAVDSVAGSWLAFSTYQDPMLPGASSAFWVYQRLGAGLVLLLPLVLLLYPDGRFPTGRWRWAGIVGLTCAALLPLAIVLAPSDAAQRAWDAAAMPTAFGRLELDPMSLPLPHDVWLVVLRAAYVLVSLSLILPFAVVVHRYRHATGLRRTQMRWLVWAALMDLLVMLSLRLLPGDVSSLGFTICVAVTAGAVAVGLTRPDVIDVDRLLSSTIVYGALVVISYLLDLLVLGASAHFLGTHVTGSQALVVSVFVVSVVYAPLRHRLWRLVRRGARGERDDPYAVVSGLAERLETTDAPEDQLLEVAGAVARAFRTSYVGVEVQQSTGGRLLVEHGPRPGAVDRMPIAYRGETIGQLLLPPGPRERLRPSDERLLADVVRQGAAAARAASSPTTCRAAASGW